MLTAKIPVLLLSIIFALLGVYLILRINTAGKKIDSTTLRARAFLDESFLKENWILLMLTLLLFIIRAVVELIETFETSIGTESSELADEIIVLGILVCVILIVHKWFRLMSPPRQFE
ncbi:Uncharacterised protein [uncultured archaeon]|nr:Uncharacterised protein [uncultured archaeon]